jgi:signal transduction histidine kinase/ActR/RegA family two-component response regulator
MGSLMRTHDWTTSALGPPARWPQSLRTVVRIMLNTGHPMYVFWGPQLCCLYNDAYSESIGPERHPGSLGRPAREVWEEIWDIIGPQIEQVMAGRGATWHVDHLVPITRHGRREEVYWTYSYSPIDDEDAPSGVGGVLVVCTETTAQVLTARRLAQSEAELREADRRKDEFLAMLAHELRNPLAPIRTGLELIRLAGDTPGAVERVRSTMERQVGHMVRLIDDLLDVSRITAGKIELQRVPSLLTDMVAAAVDANRAAFARKQIDLRVDLPHAPVVLDVDPTRFVQVMSNLLHNATKFTAAGGSVLLSAQVLDSSPAPPRLSVRVADSGDGISPELLPRVFDLFTQGERTSGEPGLGIGLALVRQLVQMHGGEVVARSEGAGHGSEFEIRMPLADVADLAPTPPAAHTERLDRRVVIIDDNEDAANTMAMLIESLGGTASVAYGGEQGIREVVAHRADVVLLDIGMQPLDGYETCRRLRQAVGPDVMIVALTGWGQLQDKKKAVAAGFNAHLTKPADPAKLRSLLMNRPGRMLLD